MWDKNVYKMTFAKDITDTICLVDQFSNWTQQSILIKL